MQNYSQIKQYQSMILTNILSSQFVYSSVNQKCELKKQELLIQNKKTKKIHYLYLFLTANKRPYAKKYYASSKNLNQKNNTVKTKAKSMLWKVIIKKNRFFEILYRMLFQIIPFQNNSEKKVLKLQENNLDLIIHYAPLTNKTVGLKSKNSYLSDIPLIWRLKWTNSTLFQKIFILKHMKILNEDFQFKRLEHAIE